jgi:hydrogenase maturation protease
VSAAPAGIVVLGLGNPLRRDEGLGLAALRRLAGGRPLPPSVRLVEGGTSALALVDVLEPHCRLLVLDAVLGHRRPGSVIRLAGDAVAAGRGRPASAHDLALPDALALSRLAGTAPRELVVLGLQPAAIGPGEGLSPPVEAGLGRLVDAACRQLRRWGVAIA